MPLTENDKSEARDALAMALAFNEPETMIEGLKRLCARKLADGHISDNERNRWQDCHSALDSVAKELELANAPAMRSQDAPSEQGEQAPPAAIVRSGLPPHAVAAGQSPLDSVAQA